MKNTVSISDGCIQLILTPENQVEESQLEDLMDKRLETELSSHLKRNESTEELSKYYMVETEFFSAP